MKLLCVGYISPSRPQVEAWLQRKTAAWLPADTFELFVGDETIKQRGVRWLGGNSACLQPAGRVQPDRSWLGGLWIDSTVVSAGPRASE